MNWFTLAGKAKLWLSFPKYAALLARLYADARVPALLKLGGIAAAVLIVSPLDPLADIPVLNIFDDAALLTLAVQLFFAFCPAGVVAEHKAALGIERAMPIMKNVTPR
jgi:uncharacterized membrane protein YkvA (DUF1232 family)